LISIENRVQRNREQTDNDRAARLISRSSTPQMVTAGAMLFQSVAKLLPTEPLDALPSTGSSKIR